VTERKAQSRKTEQSQESVWPWHEWLGHTNFSFLAGASHPSDFVDTAIEYGYRCLAVTDYDGVYGVVRAHRRLAEWEKEGHAPHLKLLVGAECHLAQDHEQPLLYQDTLAFLAPTAKAYQQMCHIINGGFTAGKHHPHIHLNDLATKPCAELIALQPMRGIIRTLDYEELRTRLRYYRSVFHDRLYLVLTLTLTAAEDIWDLLTFLLS
jgi:error-prone DNA polymerase